MKPRQTPSVTGVYIDKMEKIKYQHLYFLPIFFKHRGLQLTYIFIRNMDWAVCCVLCILNELGKIHISHR